MTEQRVLSNGDKATLERGVTVTDRGTQQALTGDKLTLSDHITLAQNEFFILDITGTVFMYGQAINLTSLPSRTAMSGVKETLSQLSPDDAKLVLRIYDEFKKAPIGNSRT